MTVVVGVRKKGRTVLAADSLVNFGGQRFGVDNCQFHKIVRVGDSLMAWAGWSLYAEYLTAYLKTEQAAPPLGTEEEIFRFFVGFWRAARREYTMTERGMGRDHPFADLESTFILANKAGLYRVSGDMDVTQFKRYTAAGSGSKYSLGALEVLYEQDGSAEEVARRAVQVGINCDVYCGGTIDIEVV
ncbi:MAG TPA: hypothetical protein VEB22_12445 [Phycisphaerales bacterium]|nr:hypothetical protein [Phycisphaerales bacterium]